MFETTTTTHVHTPMEMQRRPSPLLISYPEPESEETISHWNHPQHVHVQRVYGDLYVTSSPSTNQCTLKMIQEDALEASDEELDGIGTSPVREYPEEYAKYRMPQSVFVARAGMKSPVVIKRKRIDGLKQDGHDVEEESSGVFTNKPLSSVSKRKGSSDFLRKGQWTPTEERLARMLIEAFEEGYLPIYTGIRLRGYLAVQLQCDPMRVSKKLCAGTVDNKRIPKNYGQKKFRLRRKQLWDREEAGRILGALERLTKELWAETGILPPPYLSLASTRNADEDGMLTSMMIPDGQTPSSPVKKLSPSTNKSKKQKNGVVFPIIYLNLSKKLKQVANPQDAPGIFDELNLPYSPDSPMSGMSLADCTTSGEHIRVDGESLQAAYDLLNLHWMAPSTSTLSETTSSAPPLRPLVREMIPTPSEIPILPVPSKPAILRQQSPSVVS